LHTLLGSHHSGSLSTASATVSIASWTGFPTTGTTDTTAPPTRIGTVATFVKKHPDSPTNSRRSVSHLIPSITKPPSRQRYDVDPHCGASKRDNHVASECQSGQLDRPSESLVEETGKSPWNHSLGSFLSLEPVATPSTPWHREERERGSVRGADGD